MLLYHYMFELREEKIASKLSQLQPSDQISALIGAIIQSMPAEQEVRFHKALDDILGITPDPGHNP